MQEWFNIQKSTHAVHYINNLKGGGGPMIISLDAEKACDKIYEKNLGNIRNSKPITKHNKSNIQPTNSQHQTIWRET
jgi:hypothetical protein